MESVRDDVHPSIFTDEVVKPHTSGDRQLDRRNLRKASALLDEAGWITGDDGKRRKDGKTLDLEFLSNTPTFDRIILPYVENLEALGINATYNRIDPSQFTNRRRDRDYDMMWGYHEMALLPSTGLAQDFGSESADVSVFNPSGFRSPAVDKIIDYIVAATDTDSVKAGARALDRILRREQFMIPIWYLPEYWVATFDMYEHPDPLPPYALGHLSFWWINPEKEAALKAEGALK